MSSNESKILQILEKDPSMIDRILEASEAPVTRGMPGESGLDSAIAQILGADASADDIRSAEEALSDNKVLQLYRGAEGSLDANELISYMGGLSGNSDDKTVRAFLDGKLDLKEILIIVMLLKMFKKKNTQASYNTGSSFLSSLFGMSQPQNTGLFGNLFGVQQPQSQSLFGNLFGTQQTQTNPLYSLLGIQQPQQNTGVFGSLFGSQPQQSTGIFGFPSAQQPQTNSLNSLLQGFVSGNTGNNAQAQQFYNLLNNASNTAVNSSGQVNVGSLFSLLGQLMK